MKAPSARCTVHGCNENEAQALFRETFRFGDMDMGGALGTSSTKSTTRMSRPSNELLGDTHPRINGAICWFWENGGA